MQLYSWTEHWVGFQLLLSVAWLILQNAAWLCALLCRVGEVIGSQKSWTGALWIASDSSGDTAGPQAVPGVVSCFIELGFGNLGLSLTPFRGWCLQFPTIQSQASEAGKANRRIWLLSGLKEKGAQTELTGACSWLSLLVWVFAFVAWAQWTLLTLWSF